MGDSPGRTSAWKNSIPSSAGVFGVWGVGYVVKEGDIDKGLRPIAMVERKEKTML
jgi:hypothetical protein